MSRKIIGVTVGTQLPKPNFKQTDPTKGDYIKNKPDFEGLKTEVSAISRLVGDTSVSTQIESAIAEISSEHVVHGSEKTLLSILIENYIVNVNYDETLKFNTSEIVIGGAASSPILGQGMLGYMVLA